MSQDTYEPQFSDAEALEDPDNPGVEDDADVDVDAPEAAEDSVEEGTAEAPKAEKKKKSTRAPVPEGFISPVAFAKVLTEHLKQDHPELGVRLEADKEIRPQVVYSYIKNNPSGGKYPFPTHAAEGRAFVIKADEGLQWWDEKDLRVRASKAAKAEKEAKKAAAKTQGSDSTETAAPHGEVEDAE
jgi:hypothetical protein